MGFSGDNRGLEKTSSVGGILMNPHHTIPQATPPTAHIDIPQNILDSARLSVDGMKLELAVALYAQGRLGIGKAREL
ncbi:UPF0175 family protein, partial [Methylomagnum sp.]